MKKPITSRFWSRMPIVIIGAVAILGAIFLRDLVTLESLETYHDQLVRAVEARPFLSGLVFVAVYVLIVAFSLPGATVATLTGGFLFGLFPGVFYNVIAATLGAVAIFAAARMGFGTAAAEKLSASNGSAARLMKALRDNQWSALLTMRLVPVVPFFLANLIPAFVGVGAIPFAVTTFLGIIPAAFIFTGAGAGIGQLLADGGPLTLERIASGGVLWPLFGLGALAALPMLIKGLKRK